MRTASDPFFNHSGRDKRAAAAKRAESSEDVWGGNGDDDKIDAEPAVPERRYSPS